VPDVANTTLIVSITGIAVSGVVGPSTTAWAARRAARSQFLRDRAADRRNELRSLLDQAASVLGLGATRLRQAWEADHAGGSGTTDLQPWSEEVFTTAFASMMIAAGVNAKALSTYMGHAGVAITYDRYGHLMPGSEAEAAGLLDAYLGRAAVNG